MMSISIEARKFVFAGVALSALIGVSACTTIEGTNALVDPITFEREVANPTLAGLGVIPKSESKETIKVQRAPLVLPKDLSRLPQPKKIDTAVLPEDSDTVTFDTAGLSDEEIKRLRRVRVFDPRSTSGRPLTAEETTQLKSKFKDVILQQKTRALHIPSDAYFNTVNGQDAICLAPNGDLVPLDDPSCPAEIRDILSDT